MRDVYSKLLPVFYGESLEVVCNVGNAALLWKRRVTHVSSVVIKVSPINDGNVTTFGRFCFSPRSNRPVRDLNFSPL